jgi:hypothetical protein
MLRRIHNLQYCANARAKCFLLIMTNMSLYLQTKHLITLYLSVPIIPRDVLSQNLAFSRTLQTFAAKRGIQSSKHFPFLYKFINMLEFLIDNIFVDIGEHIVQQIIGIPLGTNCATLLADLYLYS